MLGTPTFETIRQNEEIINFYLALIVRMIPFFKHHAFRNEKEYRLLVQLTEIKSNPMDIIKYRVYKGILIPYIEIKLNPSYFKSLCLSPMNMSETAKNSIDIMISNHRPRLSKRISDIPIRQGW